METRKILIMMIVVLGCTQVAGAKYRWIKKGPDKIRVPKGHDFTKVAPGAKYEPGQLLVRFVHKENGKSRSASEKVEILNSAGGGTIHKNFRIVPELTVVELSKGLSVEKALKKFNKRKDVLYAEPNYEVKVTATEPNDTRFDELWGMHNTGQTGGDPNADIDAPEAWDTRTSAGDIIVAVIDTGVDYNHEDLAGNIWVNTGETAGNGLDDDGNGYVDDVYGYDFYNDDGDPMDDYGHGTHCSGTIGGVGNNGVGVAGVCWNVKIMALKFLDSTGHGWTNDAVDSVEYSVLMGAKLSSNSWGGYTYSQALKDAIVAASEAGVMFVAAAGNEGVNTDITPSYPAGFDCGSIISVLATDDEDNRSYHPPNWESNYGLTSVDLGAPGSSILSCQLGGGYHVKSGTSMATPHVAGGCALLWAELGTSSFLYSDVKWFLLFATDAVSDLAGECVTEGRLNIYNALSQDTSKRVLNIQQKKLYSTIQAAIDDPNTVDGDTIVALSDTYYITEPIDFLGKAITVTSGDPTSSYCVENTVIYSQMDDPCAAVIFDDSEDPCSILTGFTIMTDPCYSGRGIECDGASPTISNCAIKDFSSSGSGGGIYCHSGSDAVIEDCTITGNTGTSGAGIYCSGYSEPEVKDCTITDNTASSGDGGGIKCGENTDPTITGCTISGNEASEGGGIYSYDFTMSDCAISGNTASSGDGGGIYCKGDPTISDCSFVENEATSGDGGGFAQDPCDPCSTGTITACEFKNNSSGGNGGGIHAFGGDIISSGFSGNSVSGFVGGAMSGCDGTIVNCVIEGNTAVIGGGLDDCDGDIINCTIYGNTAWLYGGGGGGSNCDGTITNCIVWGNTGGAFYNNTATTTYTCWPEGTSGTGNIDDDPELVDTTDPDGGDDEFGTNDDGLSLGSDSPCINAGDNSAVPGGITTDIKGEDRIMQDVVDMGAYETNVYFVDPCAPGANDGTSWYDAYTDLQSALDDATKYAVIKVADGTYVPGTSRSDYFEVENSVGIYGGYAGYGASNPDERDIGTYVSILSADIGTPGDPCDNCYHVVRLRYNAHNAIIDGFTITGGCGSSCGGGIDVDGADYVTISNCVIKGNTASARAGGIYLKYSTWSIVKNCLFYDNEATSGLGGGVYSYRGGENSFINCTFSGNSASIKGGALYWNAGTGNILVNCILWGNSADKGDEIYFTGVPPEVSYCDIEGCGGSGSWDPNFGINLGGNIDSDPCFVDPCSSDYHLGSDSPCFNSGDPCYNPVTGETDIDGEERILAGRIDMGADEFDRTVHNITQDKWYQTIGDAIDDPCLAGGDEIEAYPGTYDETVDFEGASITLRSTDPADWDVVAATIIEPSSTASWIVNFDSGEDANSVFKGFTVTGGASVGLVRCATSSGPIVSNCIIEDNSNGGSGIYVGSGSAPLISNNIIRGNEDYGIYADFGSSSPTIKNCWIYDNDLYGIRSKSASGAVSNCTIADNKLYGVYGVGISMTIDNCIIWGNGYCLGRNFTLTYSCVDDPCDASGTGNITDDPCFFNYYDFKDETTAGGTTTTIAVADASLYDPCVPDIIEYDNDGVARTVTDANTATDIVTFTPALDAASSSGIRVYNWGSNTDMTEDYHLAWDWPTGESPCINSGDPCGTYTGQTDIDGDERVLGGRVDMGGDEATRVHNTTKDKWYWKINEAIDDASNGNEVVAYEDTYDENVDFDGKDITVRSTAPADPCVVAETIIDASGSGYTVRFDSGEGSNARLKGFTITGGGTYGVYCKNSRPYIQQCAITDNGSHGIYIRQDDTRYCTPDIIKNKIYNNGGRGIYGYAYLASRLRPDIKRNWIYENSGYGVYIYKGTATVYENTVAGNTSYGIRHSSSGSTTVKNCIVWDNGNDLNGCSATYSCIEDLDGGTGNIHTDPNFVDDTNGNYRLTHGSGCIDSANGNVASDWDIFGQVRIDDPNTPNTGIGDPNYVDMGACEYKPD